MVHVGRALRDAGRTENGNGNTWLNKKRTCGEIALLYAYLVRFQDAVGSV
jgi:hypothetical protein